MTNSRYLIVCSNCGVLVHLPTVRVYKGYSWNGKCCPVCKEPFRETAIKPIKTEKIEPIIEYPDVGGLWVKLNEVIKRFNEMLPKRL
jgi:hypothetical protein